MSELDAIRSRLQDGTCLNCKGEGRLPCGGTPCPYCRGSGRWPVEDGELDRLRAVRDAARKLRDAAYDPPSYVERTDMWAWLEEDFEALAEALEHADAGEQGRDTSP